MWGVACAHLLPRPPARACSRSQEFCTLLASTLDTRYITILAALCSTREGAIEDTQTAIAETIFEKPECAPLLVQLQCRPPARGCCGVVISVPAHSGGMFVAIEEFLEGTSPALVRLQKVVFALPKLLVQLCLGRSYVGIAAVTRLMPFEALQQLIGAVSLPPVLRAGYTELVLHAYLDCDPFVHLPLPVFTRVWDDLGRPVIATAPDIVPTAAVAAQFAPVRAWVVRHLTAAQARPGGAFADAGDTALDLQVVRTLTH